MQLGGTIIRVACNQASHVDFVNALGGTRPVIPRAGSVQMPCAIFLDDPSVESNLLTDLGNVVTANCVIRAGSATGDVLFEQVIAAAHFNPGLTFAQWTAGTAAHFTFAMTPSDTNFAAGPVHIAIGVTTTSAGDVSLVYCSTASVKDYGIFNAAAPAAPDYTSWSKAEADGRYAPVGSAGLATDITSIGTGAPGSLETIPTTTLSLPALRSLLIGNVPQDWYLLAGTDANDVFHQRPNDYHASTNARVWVRLR